MQSRVFPKDVRSVDRIVGVSASGVPYDPFYRRIVVVACSRHHVPADVVVEVLFVSTRVA